MADIRPDDAYYMRRALLLASGSVGLSSPNPAVGCVIVREGCIVGEGHHEYALMHHAEIAALKRAGDQARGGTVYLTLEPCSHQGRTPPCAPVLIESGIRRAVIATEDPNPAVCGRGIEWLRSSGVQVEVGLMQERALGLIEPFACYKTTGRPLVVAKAGMSLDGRIAAPEGQDHWITSPDARDFSQLLRLRLDAVLCGIGTLLADDPALTYRGTARKARTLLRVVLDSELKTPPNARIFQAIADAPVLIVCAPEAALERRRQLERRGAEILQVPRAGDGLDLNLTLDHLAKRQVLGVLIEGGSRVHWAFLSERLIDKFYFILAPLVLGGHESIPCVGGAGYNTVAEAPRFQIRRKFSVGSDLVLESYPAFSRSILSPWLPSKISPSRVRYSARASKRK